MTMPRTVNERAPDVYVYWYWPAHDGGAGISQPFRVEVTKTNEWPDGGSSMPVQAMLLQQPQPSLGTADQCGHGTVDRRQMAFSIAAGQLLPALDI